MLLEPTNPETGTSPIISPPMSMEMVPSPIVPELLLERTNPEMDASPVESALSTKPNTSSMDANPITCRKYCQIRVRSPPKRYWIRQILKRVRLKLKCCQNLLFSQRNGSPEIWQQQRLRSQILLMRMCRQGKTLKQNFYVIWVKRKGMWKINGCVGYTIFYRRCRQVNLKKLLRDLLKRWNIS